MRWNWSIVGFLICALVVAGLIPSASLALEVSNATPNRLRLLAAAERVFSTMKSSKYQHVTYVDEPNGIYDFDCGGFVGYLLQQTFPDALTVIKYHPNRLNRPYVEDYYNFFALLGSMDNSREWHTVQGASDLLPGDVIAWLGPIHGNYTALGHVMIVRSNPVVDSKRSNEINLEIIDSTRSPHAFDSRVNGTNGVGIGIISLVLNTTGNAVGFRWRDGQSVRIEHTKIAYGEPGPRSAIYGTLNSSSDRVVLPMIATVILLVCAVVSSILIMKLRRDKSPRQEPNL